MSIALLDLGTQMAAIGCIMVGFGLLATGRAPWLGYTFRTAIEPALTRFREGSERSRAELATGWTVAASALAGLAVVVERSLFAAILAVLLWLARPAVARLTMEEHPLLALANSFTIDLVIGMYLPITISQLLLRNVVLASSFTALIVALSWPTGGGSSGRPFRFATLS